MLHAPKTRPESILTGHKSNDAITAIAAAGSLSYCRVLERDVQEVDSSSLRTLLFASIIRTMGSGGRSVTSIPLDGNLARNCEAEQAGHIHIPIMVAPFVGSGLGCCAMSRDSHYMPCLAVGKYSVMWLQNSIKYLQLGSRQHLGSVPQELLLVSNTCRLSIHVITGVV